MRRLSRLFSSPEKRAARFEKELRNAVLAHNQPKIISTFSEEFKFLLREKKTQLLSDLILAYVSTLKDVASLEEKIPSADLKQAVSFLAENKLDPAALMLCDFCGYRREAIELLARLGQANELARRLSKDNVYDKALLGGCGNVVGEI